MGVGGGRVMDGEIPGRCREEQGGPGDGEGPLASGLPCPGLSSLPFILSLNAQRELPPSQVQ